MVTNAITPYSAIRKYMRSDYMLSRFTEIMDSQSAKAYIGSVLITVSASTELQECTPQSIAIQAMRAATLGLSCDPDMKQAHLVPFKNWKTKQKEATLIIHWKGLVKMASQTGEYEYINVADIYEGETVTEDRISGLHTVTGMKTSERVIGRLASFKTLAGYRKSVYMTTEQIHEHAKKHSRSYDNDKSAWKDPKKLPDMERKTPMRQLMSWAKLSPLALAIISHDDADTDDVVGGELLDPEELDYGPEFKNSPETNISILTGDGNPDPVKDKTWQEWELWKERAQRVRVEVSNVDRKGTTEKDLQAYLKEVSMYILDAEQQAAAV